VTRRLAAALGLAVLVTPVIAPVRPAAAEIVTHKVGKLSLTADTAYAFPGGVLVVRLARPMGTTYAILHGRRIPFLDSPRGVRALVPVPVTAASGPTTLGIELMARGGRQRIATDVVLPSRAFSSRTVVLPEAKRPLLNQPGSQRDGRRLLIALRTLTPQALCSGSLQPPVGVAPQATFGLTETFVGATSVDAVTDSTYGEYHRGLDYDVPAGTPVQAPAAGIVVLAAPLTLTGQTLVLDHGQGIISAFYHLGRIDVHEGDHVDARASLGVSGDSGLAASPHLHWGVYLHGIAVDPAVVQKVLE
jgi:murein DD-endopeptidase MepM/ murein hydrolase activator NlpD